MFKKWLEAHEDASWNQLIEALKSIKLVHLATQIEQKLVGKSFHVRKCASNVDHEPYSDE